MEFCWFKTKGTFERIDTANPGDRKKGAANYLAKNVGEVCGMDLTRLSEAGRWLSTFRVDGTRASLRRYGAIGQIDGTIRRLVEFRYIDLTELLENTDSPQARARKNVRNAAAAYAMAYESGLLTSRPFLNPLVVHGQNALPEIRPRSPEKVLAAILSVSAEAGDGRVPVGDLIGGRIARALDRLYPLGRDWIEPVDLTVWHKRLLGEWEKHLTILPLVVAPGAALDADEVPKPTTNCPPAEQPTQPVPSGQAKPMEPQPMDIEPMASGPTVVGPVVAGIEQDPELTQPAPATPEDDRRHAEYLSMLEAAVVKPMATLSREEREGLITLRMGQIPPRFQNPSRTNQDRAAALAKKIAERKRGDGMNWAELLIRDGFDLRDLPAIVARLQSALKSGDGAAGRQLEGYHFQIRETLTAWEEYRLCRVEVRLPGDLQPWPRGDRFIDTIEWVTGGDIRFREYKAYNPDWEPPQDQQRAFAGQLDDYFAAIGTDFYGLPIEYVFAFGIPNWARAILQANARDFPNGLYVTDAQTETTTKL